VKGNKVHIITLCNISVIKVPQMKYCNMFVIKVLRWPFERRIHMYSIDKLIKQKNCNHNNIEYRKGSFGGYNCAGFSEGDEAYYFCEDCKLFEYEFEDGLLQKMYRNK